VKVITIEVAMLIVSRGYVPPLIELHQALQRLFRARLVLRWNLVLAPLEESHEEDSGWTAFMWAVRCGLGHIATLLDKEGADTSRYGDA
jgi:hypothetical protein